jgi:hypothetical protein
MSKLTSEVLPSSRPCRILDPPKARNKLDPLIPLHLLPLLRLRPHRLHTLIHALTIIISILKHLLHALKARMLLEMALHPLVQILYIGNRVHDSAGAQHVRILGVERVGHDARLVLALLEVRVREAEEDFGELGLGEEVGQEFHRVGAQAGYVLIAARRGVLDAQGAGFFLDVFCY